MGQDWQHPEKKPKPNTTLMPTSVCTPWLKINWTRLTIQKKMPKAKDNFDANICPHTMFPNQWDKKRFKMPNPKHHVDANIRPHTTPQNQQDKKRNHTLPQNLHTDDMITRIIISKANETRAHPLDTTPKKTTPEAGEAAALATEENWWWRR